MDNNGNIFILDGGNYRVLKFDPKGNFLLSFGRKGKGPGEFIRPNKIRIGSNNNVYINQSNKLINFTNDGEYLENIVLSQNYHYSPYPESLSRASRYLDLVFSIISGGNFGGGGCLGQSRPFR